MNPSRHVNRSGVTFLAVVVLSAVYVVNASAACPSSFGPRISGVAWSNGPSSPGRSQASLVNAAYFADRDDREPSIVGLWKINFLADGQVIDQGFDAWHGDGTETLNDSVPPSTGNVCLGVWEKTASRTYKLKHLSWNYDAAGNAVGITIIRELIRLDRNGNAYNGTLVFQVYDLADHLLFQGNGEVTGRRITVD